MTALSSQGIGSYINQPHTKQQNTLTIKLPLPPPPPNKHNLKHQHSNTCTKREVAIKVPIDIMLLVCQHPYLTLFNSALSPKHSASYFCLFKKVFHNIQVRKKTPPSTIHHPYPPPSTSSYLLLPIHFITFPPPHPLHHISHPFHHISSSPSTLSLLLPIHFIISPPPHPLHHLSSSPSTSSPLLLPILSCFLCTTNLHTRKKRRLALILCWLQPHLDHSTSVSKHYGLGPKYMYIAAGKLGVYQMDYQRMHLVTVIFLLGGLKASLCAPQLSLQTGDLCLQPIHHLLQYIS